MLLTCMLQLSPGEAATAAAVGPGTSALGEALEPLLPSLAAAQREGAVSTEQVRIVERAIQKLPNLNSTPSWTR
jgi:Domain of unknown function (DUF222)